MREMVQSRKGLLVALLAVSALSMFCTRVSNREIASLLNAPWLSATCLPAVVVAIALYVAIRPARPFALWQPTTPWKRVKLLSILWLATWMLGSLLYALSQGAWIAYVTGVAAVLGFVLVGPLTEELLFRGAVFELAERAWPKTPLFAITLSSALFSAYHLQLHAYQVTPFVMFQLVFTLGMGYVLALVRSFSGSIWPGLVLHVATNLPHAIGAS